MAMSKIPDKMFFRIGEVGRITGVKPYVLRYWESEFKLLRPTKNKSGQRIYRRKDIDTVLDIKSLLYKKKYTIAGAKKKLSAESSLRGAQQMELGFTPPHIKAAIDKIRAEIVELDKMLK